MIGPLLALALLAQAPADQLALDFQAANERALSGDLEGAIGLYRSLEQRGIDHPDLYFNAGNALAKSGRLAEAALAYERALALAPGDADARLNLGAVRAKLQPKTSDQPKEVSVLSEAIEPIVAPLPRDAFAIGLLTAWMIFFGAMILRRLWRRGRRIAGWLEVPALLATLAFGAVVAGHELVERTPRSVVLEATELKDGPDPRYPSSGPLAAGGRVLVRSEDLGWSEIQDDQGRVGWVATTKLGRIR